MAMKLFAADVIFLQRFLISAGFDPGPIDGIYGSQTDAAVLALEAVTIQVATDLGSFDLRTERCIQTLHPKAQQAARKFMQKVLDAGIQARIISGTRTYAEQNELFRKGRFGNPGPRVTNARGGQSNHNFGIAWDLGIFDNGKYLTDSPLYKKAAQTGLVEGLEWGGNWVTFPDLPHYQLATNKSIQIVQADFENGELFV